MLGGLQQESRFGGDRRPERAPSSGHCMAPPKRIPGTSCDVPTVRSDRLKVPLARARRRGAGIRRAQCCKGQGAWDGLPRSGPVESGSAEGDAHRDDRVRPAGCVRGISKCHVPRPGTQTRRDKIGSPVLARDTAPGRCTGVFRGFPVDPSDHAFRHGACQRAFGRRIPAPAQVQAPGVGRVCPAGLPFGLRHVAGPGPCPWQVWGLAAPARTGTPPPPRICPGC